MDKSVKGYLRESDGYWRIVISYYQKDKRKQKTISTGLKITNNKRKAEAMLKQELEKFNNALSESSGIIDNAKLLFNDCMDMWLDNKSGITKTTHDNYYLMIHNHIKPYFTGKRLVDIKPKDINSYCMSKLDKIESSSVRKHLNLMRQALDNAVLMEYINRNPTIGVTITKSKKKADDKVVLTSDEAKRMLEVMQSERIYPIIALTLYYGMRKEEVLGLTWNDIDFKNHSFTINNTVTQSAKGVITFNNFTKTVKSNRTYPMSTATENIFRVAMQEQNYYKDALMSAYIGNMHNLVFTYEDGRMYRPDYVVKKFQKLLKKYQFKNMRFYDLRHSCATIMRDNNIPVEKISCWLGHSDVSTTTDIYIHKDKDININTGVLVQDIFKVG